MSRLEGAHRALTAYRTLVVWNVLQSLGLLPIAVVLQALVGAGTVVGMALLIPGLDAETARFLATGGPTFALISVGLSVVPQSVVEARRSGVYDHFASLPIPRLTHLFAEMTVTLLVALPGAVVALLLASWRFGFTARPHLVLLVVVPLVAACATAMGYGIASVIRSPQVAVVASNALVFGALLFAPINFPASRLPGWLQGLHRALPFASMAELMRNGLGASHAAIATPLVTVGLWAAVSLAAATLVIGRRA